MLNKDKLLVLLLQIDRSDVTELDTINTQYTEMLSDLELPAEKAQLQLTSRRQMMQDELTKMRGLVIIEAEIEDD